MNRIGNILNKTASTANIDAAVDEALRHRSKKNALTRSASIFLLHRAENVEEIRNALLTGNIGDITYNTFYKCENGKVRKIDWNPSFRDNVMQHALFRTVGKKIIEKFIPDTFSGIEGRGPSYGLNRLRKHIRAFNGKPLYILKFDIRHYYPSIDLELLKKTLRTVIKDSGILKVFDAIIDSHPNGLPIGNYISQLLANLYLNEFDHWVQRELKITILRYCDDVVLLGSSSKELCDALKKVRCFLRTLKLTVKNDIQIFPIERGGIDFMGFIVTRDGVKLRKRIERSLRRSIKKFNKTPIEKYYRSIASYYGWTTSLTRGGLLWKRIAKKPLSDYLAEARKVS